MKPSTLELFARLTATPTAPYYEAGPTKAALAWIKKNLGQSVKVSRHRGGVAVRYQGAGKGPAIAFAAHLDHPAFHLSKVTQRGAVGQLLGGLPPHLLKGNKVEAFDKNPRDNKPLAVGVLGQGDKKGRYPIAWTQAPARGARLAFATLKLTPCSIRGKWLWSRSIDDLLGCAVSLEALRRAAKSKLKANVTVLLHRAEEVGFMGALDLIAQGEVSLEDSILSIESSRQLPGARPGRGPVIRLGDKAAQFDLNLTGLLDEAASRLKKRRIPTQRLRLTGGTCEATAYLAFGYEASGVAIPLVNYHNGWGANKIAPEKVRLEDVAGAVELLVEAAKLFPDSSLRGKLRLRLEARHRDNIHNF